MLLQTLTFLVSLVYCVLGGPLCFSCSGIQQARYCDYTERCADHQVCHVQKMLTNSGHHVFTSGCINNATCGMKRSAALPENHGDVTCIECCHGEMCNNNGCGDAGPPARQYRGPYCFQCDHMSRPSECEQLTVCELDEQCAIEEYATGFFGEHTFSSGCKRREQCENYKPFGRRGLQERKVELCDQCCLGDFCNQDCDGHVPASHVGHWLNWGAWSGCPKGSCSASNYQIRKRICMDNITHQEVHNCPGDSRENRTCGGECKDCKAIYNTGTRRNGVYTITPTPGNSFDVYCDMDDGGWIVIQNRINGTVNFTRGWSDYVYGFGSLDGEFWLGLEKIYNLTHPQNRIVKFDLQKDDSKWLNATYNEFYIDNNASKYSLQVSGSFHGNISSSSFKYNNGYDFYTYDNDNSYGCAKSRHGGWWYNDCTYLNINGKYGLKNEEYGVIEHYNEYNNLIQTRMKLK